MIVMTERNLFQRWWHRCSRVIVMIVMTVMTDDRNLFKDGDIVVAESGQEGGAWDRGGATTKQGNLVVAIIIFWFYWVFYSCFCAATKFVGVNKTRIYCLQSWEDPHLQHIFWIMAIKNNNHDIKTVVYNLERTHLCLIAFRKRVGNGWGQHLGKF